MATELYDSITGVYSRSLLNTRLQHEVQRAVRSNQPLSLLMLDVDFFKSINDAFGHNRGDQALAEVAARIRAQMRLSDEIFRYGGDEFVILLPQINKQQAIILAQRISDRVSEVPLTGDPPLMLSVSIGIASYPEDGDTSQRLFEMADHRHYQSKIMGRAQVVSQDVDIPNGQAADEHDRLIERDQALSQLKQFTDMLENAPRGILHVTGQAGIGHTRFLQEVRNIFRLRGYASLWLSGQRAMRSRMYGAVIEAFNSWENPPQMSAEAIEAYLADFIRQKNLNGLVLLLDDWQSLDEASMALVNYLYNSNKLEHLSLAYASEEHDSIPWIEAEKDKRFAINLPALTEMGVRAWLRKSIGQEPPDELIHLITRLTGGLPADLARVIGWLAIEEKQNLGNQNYATVLVHLQNEYEHILENADHPPNNLPENLPPFLDREAEIVQIKRLLKEQRLVTVTGAGGMGKTRLALQAAGEILNQYQDGIFFVRLHSISSPAFIVDTISQAMKFSLDPKQDTLEQFLQHLASKQILLILDNFESVLDKADLLQQFIDRAPAVRILVTSREPLNLPGEAVLELGGLSFPTPDSTDDIEQYPAVRLFMLYARYPSDFEPDLLSIGRICRLVDGIPLAIELASTWVSALSTEQIALSIEQSLSFLSSSAEAGDRRNLIAVFDSVWELFSKNEMRVLTGLGIFRGGFSHQAAERITGASHFFLDALANKLLVFRRGANRYALHATFSQYLLEKLRADPLLASHIEAQHNLFYLGYLRESEAALRRSTTGPLVNEILADIENIRTAWNQMVSAENFRALESTLSAWMVLLGNRGWYREAIADLRVLDSKVPEAAAGGVNDVELFGIRIKSYLGEFYYHIGNYEAGVRELQEALELAKLNNFHREEAEIYRLLGNHYSAVGRPQEAKEMYQMGLAIAEKRRDLYLVYQFMNSLGVGVYKDGDFQGAIPIVKRALRIARKLENRNNIAQSLNNLGNLYFETGDCPRARKILSKALTYLPDVESQTMKGTIYHSMGKVLMGCEEFSYASEILSRGLSLVREIEATPLAIEMLVSVAQLFEHLEEKPLALTLAGLTADHPAASAEVKARALQLIEKLAAENVEPADRKWHANQLQRVLKDVIHILDQKAAG